VFGDFDWVQQAQIRFGGANYFLRSVLAEDFSEKLVLE